MRIYCADVGSVANKKFGWFSNLSIDADFTNIDSLCKNLKNDLLDGNQVALGFECPLFINMTSQPNDLLKARDGLERALSRSWSASAGTSAMAAGLAEALYIFKKLSDIDVRPTFQFSDIAIGTANLFIWEAFVTSSHSTTQQNLKKTINFHVHDAMLAVQELESRIKQAHEPFSDFANTDTKTFSIIGAALLRSGVTTSLNLLSERCIVVRIDKE